MAKLTMGLRSVLMLLLVVGTMVGAASAQSARGDMAGSVTDSTGAAIPGATVSATNLATGGKSQTKSTSAGSYHLGDLPLGAYTVTVTAPGFGTTTSTGVQVQINSTTALNVTLKAGAVTEVVNVDASGLRLETESSDISGTVSNKQIEDLPLSLAQGVNGMRSPESFEFLVPGTTGPGSATQGNTGNGVFFARISGGQAYGNETLLDGASVQRSENGSSFDETSPSIEALQEFKVTTSTPSAEFGRTTSGITSFSVKSGTNDFHGTGFLLVKNRAFDANNWFNNGYQALNCKGIPEIQCQYTRPEDSRYDYGGVFDGPVHIPHVYNGKDRTFFLFAWENYKFQQGTIQTSTVPTAQERTGNFSDVLGGPVPGGSPYPGVPYNVLLNPCTGTPVLYNQIFDPTTSKQIAPDLFCRTAFNGNIITSPLSQTAQKLLAGLPLPNRAPLSTDVFGYNGNYAVKSIRPFTNTTYTIRIDQNLTDRNKIFATYDTRQNFSLNGSPNLPGNFNSGDNPQLFTTHYTRAGWDFTITPSLLNHLNLGYNRTNSNNVASSLGSPDTLASLGIPNDHSVFYPRIDFPSPDQPTSFGDQSNGDNIDNGTRINDSVSWQKGRHNFKFGVDYRYQQYTVIQYNQDTLDFYRDQTAALNFACCGSGDPIASLLLGEVGNGYQAVYNDHPRWNSHYQAFFGEDDIKLSKNLTVNLGLRYDIDTPRHEALNRSSEFSLTAPDAAAGGHPGALVFGTTCNCNTAWAATWYKDIAPRLGFAYVLPGTNGKAVIRGGGAILYGPLQYSDFGSSMALGYNQNWSFNTPENAAANTGGAFTPAFRLDSSSAADPTNSTIGFPAHSFAPNLDPTQLTAQQGPGSFDAVGGEVILPQNGRPSMTDNWSIQLQDELAQDLIFTMGYIGQEAQNLHSGYLSNINNLPESDFALGDKLTASGYRIPTGGSNNGVNAPYSSFTGQLGQALRPFPQYDYIAGDCCLENLGHSSYHAMVVSLNRRFRQGFNLQASYTWSKMLTDADSAIPFSYVTGNSGNGLRQGEGSTNLRLDKAVSVQDIPQQFSLSYLLQLPFGKGRKWLNHNHALDLLVGGWEFGGIQRYQSGSPISFGCASGIPFYQNCVTYTAGPASNGGKDFASDSYKKNKNGPNFFNQQSWFKPAYRIPGAAGGSADPGVPLANAAFIDQNSANGPDRHFTPACAAANQTVPCSFDPYTLGNISRVTTAITGPIYLAEDISLLKDFHMYERLTFQFKLEAFDVLNRHRMALPDTSPGDVCTVGGTGCMLFGIPTAVDYGPRTLQFSGKISF